MFHGAVRGWLGPVLPVSALLVACGGTVAPATQPPPTPALPETEPETPWSACVPKGRPEGKPAAIVENIGRRCGAASGQHPLGPVRDGSQGEVAAVDRYTFHVGTPGSCFRVYAAGSDGIAELDVEVMGPSGELLATDELDGPVTAVPYRNPLCVGQQGVYTVEVSVVRGGGEYALQIWTHQRPLDEVLEDQTRSPGAEDLPQDHRR